MRSPDMSYRSVPGMFVIVLLALGLLSGCNRGDETAGLITESPDGYWTFPEFFLEKGVDADSSYIALQGLRKSGGILELQATSWGIRETGLFLARQKASKAAVYVFMGECGTVSTRTWEKVTLHYELTAADQDTINRILFTSHGDTLEVVRTHIAVLPSAR
jgi:hypothetical protein